MAHEKMATEIFEKETIEQRRYWVERLSRELGTSNIPLDYERPADFCADKGSLAIELPSHIHEGIHRLANGSPFLVYVTLLAALKICLQKYTGGATVTVGSPSRKKADGSPREASALVIATEIVPRASVKQILLDVRESLLAAYANQSYPFERLIRDLNLGHIDNRCPLFDVALALRNIHNPMPELKNDITITLTSTERGTDGTIEFNQALFTTESLIQFRQHWLSVIERMVADANQRVSDIEMLSDEERRQVVVEWNQTRRDVRAGCIHQHIEERAVLNPTATAVLQGDRRMSYAELNARANQLARHLQSLGVGAERFVGICMDRSAEMIVSALAVWKAGGAYVPLDPTYPVERLAFMISDSRIGLVLTQESLAEPFDSSGVSAICVDRDWPAIAVQETGNLPPVSTDHLAYVIYTSGSTGQPKGVLITHRGLVSVIHAQIEAFAIQPESRVLQFASMSFDASVSEIFTTLTAGATLVVATAEAMMPGPSLARLLGEQGVTHVTLPPSALAVMPNDPLPQLETLIVAGEACPTEIMRRWASGRRFINAYGPTETTICATTGLCRDMTRRPPIGRAIWNTQIYLLDEQQRPAAIGVPGELYVGGTSLARGYLNRAELTAERFVPDPFSAAGGARLYRSGDLARYGSDGEIDYLGRRDHQVKIRGFRVEPGEIEALLSQHTAVREAVVVAREDQPGDKRLVAYYVSTGELATTTELRAFLKQRLPDYLIPAVFMQVEAMPLTPAGKIDRRALPSPQSLRPDVESSYVAPRTPVEQTLVGLWKEILGIEKIGVEDHFFDLGGHSLLATQLVSRVRETFQVEIPLRWFFVGEPTVAGLARAIEEFQIEEAEADEVAAALAELDGLSDEEVRALLAGETTLPLQQ